MLVAEWRQVSLMVWSGLRAAEVSVGRLRALSPQIGVWRPAAGGYAGRRLV